MGLKKPKIVPPHFVEVVYHEKSLIVIVATGIMNSEDKKKRFENKALVEIFRRHMAEKCKLYVQSRIDRRETYNIGDKLVSKTYFGVNLMLC